jgi:hypothetical protein
MSAKEYREYADECMRWAKNSTLVKECREFLQTAEAWLQAADLLEAEPRRTAVVQPNSNALVCLPIAPPRRAPSNRKRSR